MSKTKREIIDDFQIVYYNSRVWTRTYWFGLNAGKCPLDLWVFQEILYETRPTVVIESGTGGGGTSLFLANIFDLLGKGRVITIDRKKVRRPNKHPLARPPHPRITYLLGYSTSGEIQTALKGLIAKNDRVMVDLDSAHGKSHVLEELNLFCHFVTPGCYLVVDDTNLGHPIGLGPKQFWGYGPWEAVDEFLKSHPHFKPDKEREKFYQTFNPRGYLKRIGE